MPLSPLRLVAVNLGFASGLLAVVSATVAGQDVASATAFVDVTVIPMDRERLLPHQVVVVQGNRIVALGPVGQVQVPTDARRIDGQSKYLIPGLGDMHRHDVTSDSLLLLGLLAAGITTVRDMHAGGIESKALAAKRAVVRGDVPGPRIYTAGDIDFAWRTFRSVKGDTMPFLAAESSLQLATIADSVAMIKRAGHDFVKLYGWPNPIYDSVVVAARRIGLRVVGHVPALFGRGTSTHVSLERVLLDRWASIEHLTGYTEYLTGGFPEAGLMPFEQRPWVKAILDTAAWVRPGYQWDTTAIRKIAAAARKAGVWHCPTLAVINAYRSVPPWGGPRMTMVLQVTKALQEAGVGLLLGTDVFGPHVMERDIADELRLMVEAAELTPYQALATGTRNVAAFLGTQDSTGTVAVGKRADLVLLAGNPLKNIHAVASPVGVMVGGRWLDRAELDVRLGRQASP